MASDKSDERDIVPGTTDNSTRLEKKSGIYIYVSALQMGRRIWRKQLFNFHQIVTDKEAFNKNIYLRHCSSDH